MGAGLDYPEFSGRRASNKEWSSGWEEHEEIQRLGGVMEFGGAAF